MRLLTIAALAALTVGSDTGCYTQKQVESGFLGDKYALMQPVDDNSKNRFYANPARSVKSYSEFIVDPVVIRMAKDAPGADINPDDLKDLTDFARAEIIKDLSQYYRVADKPGPGVARIRGAITGVTEGKPAMNVLPQTKITGIGLGGAAYESEMVDSVTGELIQCSMNASKGSLTDLEGGVQHWGNARHLIEDWAKDAIERLNAAKGVPMKQQ